jgi:uncharacterized membrane protein
MIKNGLPIVSAILAVFFLAWSIKQAVKYFKIWYDPAANRDTTVNAGMDLVICILAMLFFVVIAIILWKPI